MMLPEYKILRDYRPEGVVGIFSEVARNRYICRTLERPWNKNKPNSFKWPQQYPLNDSSCIPEGRYTVRKYSSAKWPDVWEVTDVLGRTKILFHWANCIDELLGCIAFGSDFLDNVYHATLKKKYRYWITQSRFTVNKLRNTLPNEFTLIITSTKGYPCE
jgi:hypothetical protein